MHHQLSILCRKQANILLSSAATSSVQPPCLAPQSIATLGGFCGGGSNLLRLLRNGSTTCSNHRRKRSTLGFVSSAAQVTGQTLMARRRTFGVIHLKRYKSCCCLLVCFPLGLQAPHIIPKVKLMSTSTCYLSTPCHASISSDLCHAQLSCLKNGPPTMTAQK